MRPLMAPPAELLSRIAGEALREDRAFEDVSTLAVVPGKLAGTGRIVAKAPGVVAGLAAAEAVFSAVDAGVAFERMLDDGATTDAGDLIAVVRGPVSSLLQGERTALNLLQRLSGIATLTREYVERVAGTGAVILDTRKTTPLLRDLEKYAVRCGGGTNHRRDLASMAMLKDNHLAAIARAGGSLADAVSAVRARAPGISVEVEIDSLSQLAEALDAGPEWILLDNMTPDEMREAVRRTAGRAKLEASGGMTLESVRAAAETGVDAISVGALTHSAAALDIGLDLEF